MAYLHFICQYFQWFTILTEHKTRHNWIPSCCSAKVTAQPFSCESRVMWLHCRKVTWLHILLSWKQHCFQISMLLYLCFQYCPAFFLQPFFFFWRSVNLKTKICLNWLQRAQGGFVSMVMRVLIGPEAQAANRPLLACRGLCLLVSLMNSFADGGWQGLIYQAGTEGWWGWGWLEEVKKENMYKGTVRAKLLELESWVTTRGSRVHLSLEWYVTSPHCNVPTVH